MCLLCIEVQKNRMKSSDFIKNYVELLISDPEHARDMMEKYPEQIEDINFSLDELGGEEDPETG